MNRIFRSVMIMRQNMVRSTALAINNSSNNSNKVNATISSRWQSSTAVAGGGGSGGGPTDGKPIIPKEEMDKLVRTNKVVIFMKGNPQAPRCGFSNAVVQIMRMHGVQYDAHDVLKDEDLRQAIKDYTDWPTIPQVFIDGEFVGGCDILLQMHQSGDLIEELKKVGITSELLEAAEVEEKSKK